MRILLVSFLLLPLWASAQTTVTLQVIEGAATEAGPVSAVLRFERDEATTSSLTVFVTRGASSTASNADFSDNNGGFFKQLSQVSIPTGESAFDLEISPTPDNLVEPLETLEIELADGDYTIGTNDPVSITIADDPPIVTLSASAMNPANLNAAENGATAQMDVSRTGGNLAASLQVNFIIDPASTAVNADYSDNNGGFFEQLNQANIAAGQSVFTLELTATPDNLVEGPETLDIRLAAGNYQIGSPDQALVTIADDAPVVTLVPGSLTATENGAPAQMDVSRTGGNLAASLQVNFVIDPASTAVNADYSDNNGGFFEQLNQANIAAGQSVFTLELTATPDNLVEGPETLDIRLAAGNYQIGSPDQALVTIADDAPVVTLTAVNLTTAEGGTPALIRFSRSGGGVAALTVNTVVEPTSTASGADYTDNNGGHFEQLNQVTIGAGETAFDLQISAVQDGLEEGTERLDFSLADGNYLQTGLTSVSIEILDELIFSDGFEAATGK